MNTMRFVGRWVIAGILVFAAAHPLAASVLRYDIAPGGQYTYLPSPESHGIPGCNPSDFECVFGIDGSFSVMVDPHTRIATLLNVDLTLIGNDEVQQSAPTPLVTAEGVANWLEDRSFQNLATADLDRFETFEDETHPILLVTDSLNDTVTLSGGFNHTPHDGDGVHFELTAEVVPDHNGDGVVDLADLAIVQSGLASGFTRMDAALVVRNLGFGISATEASALSVPEPSSFLLAALGLIGCALRWRRGRRSPIGPPGSPR